MYSNVRAAESGYGLAMHDLSIVLEVLYSCTSESSCAICHDIITCHAIYAPRVLHFSAFILAVEMAVTGENNFLLYITGIYYV